MNCRALPVLVSAPMVLSGLLGPPHASIIIRHDRDDARYLELGRRYAPALVAMNLEAEGGPPDGHGVLVASGWVLTAAHVAAEVEVGHELTVEGGNHAAEAVILHPDWDGGAGDDIALIRLATPVPDVTPVGLYRGADEVGRTVVVVGRGALGTGLTGPTGNDGGLRGATNRVDGADDGLLWWRFDAPADSGATELEGISGPGDSGGPALLDVDGSVHVVGVSSTQSTRATGGREGIYGVTEYYVRVSDYLEWLERVMAEAAGEPRQTALTRPLAQEPSASTHPAPGPEAAVAAVDAFVRGLGRADTVAMANAFTRDARAYEITLDEEPFAPVDWLPRPWHRHVLEAFRAPAVPPEASARVTVLDRAVSGSMVWQRERIRSSVAGEPVAEFTWAVLYRTRGEGIHRVWYSGVEPDPREVPAVDEPTYPEGAGPTVWVDVSHGNTATPGGTLWGFSELLRRDGYRVRSWQDPFGPAALDAADVLVIVNGSPAAGGASSSSGGPPTAFTAREVEALTRWVARGGALLLAADHAPYAGYAAPLAAAFGATFHDGFARDTSRERGGNILFRREDGTLRAHAITDGRSATEDVDAVATLLGQAFEASAEIEPLLVLPASTVLESEAYGPARGATPSGGWLQGGVRDFGDGRVALFGEVWMFREFDFDDPRLEGAQNGRFVLNLMRWLSDG